MTKNRMWGFLLLFSFWIPEAFAYIDPGSGSAIMSAIIGFLLRLVLRLNPIGIN
ncbi:hypothetical protein [Legionella tunisiensis]|uniref:hypothetical protein n=1 Tax=Legionella tunisiensis TaxID=1034944 RepID=UPI0002ED0D82|nr:hypothetical protein [Legionella tunisiensis]